MFIFVRLFRQKEIDFGNRLENTEVQNTKGHSKKIKIVWRIIGGTAHKLLTSLVVLNVSLALL